MVRQRWLAGLLWSAFVASASAAAVQYGYDSLNRLVRVVYPDGTIIAYIYDSAGNRLSQVVTNPSVAAPKVAVDKSSLSFSASTGQTAVSSQVVVVSNGGGGSLQWNATPSVTWLSVTPGSGTNSGVVAVTASVAGLAAGTYNGSVVIYASASNTPLTIPVTLAVGAASGRPAISHGGVVTAAGYTAAVARGAVGSLYGAVLADSTDSASGVPLPRTLAGVSVTVNGVSAPLWFVSPGQINFQIPFEAPMSGTLPVVVTRNGVASEVMNVQVQPYAPAVFVYQRTAGVFDPIIVRAVDNSIVSPSNPALPGDVLVVYATGLGNLTSSPRTGELTPSSPLMRSTDTPTITLGGAAIEVQFSGLTPGAVGLAQFNIKLPSSLAQKDSLPLVIQFGAVSSPSVNLAIRSNGPAKPDITMQPTDVQPRTPLPTDNIWITGTIKNPAHFSGNIVTKLYVSQTQPIAADTAQVSLPYTWDLKGSWDLFTWNGVALPQGLKPGAYYLAVGAMFPGNTDPAGVVLSDATQIQVLDQRPPFDLAVQLKDLSPATVGAGDPVDVHYSVSETAGASGTFSRSIYLSSTPTIATTNTLVNTRTFDLVKGAFDLTSTGNSIPRNVAPGNYYVGVIVQTSGDSNAANNTSSSMPITVISQRAAFDIGVQSVSATPTTVAPGGTFTVTYNVKNTSGSTGIYNRSIYLSTDQSISTADQLLSTGTFSLTRDDAQFTTAAITLPASVTAGKYYLGVILENQGDTNLDDNISAAVAVLVGSSTGMNAVSAFDASESRSGSDVAGPRPDVRTDGADVTSERGRTEIKENQKHGVNRQ